SMSADGITMPHRQHSERRTSAESDEAFKKWESQMNSSRARNQRRTSSVEGFDEFEQSVKRRKYQPTREEYEDAGAEEYAEEESTKSGISSVKSKAKEFLGDIFPFKED
ncbi:MAG: hypothetical protein LIO59_00985, partial [Oscillospiraceae bacterium]|nr:hypothetical protein [Oscillospiraceae bacterium]